MNRFFLTSCVTGLAASFVLSPPVYSAERLVVSLGAIERSIPVSAVRTFVQEGKITPELEPYTALLSSPELANLRTSLPGGDKLKVTAVDKLLRSPLGIELLKEAGQVIRVSSDQSGELAISSALVIAASQPDGINLINFLEAFPTSQVFVDGQKIQSIVAQVQSLVAEARKVDLEETATPTTPASPIVPEAATFRFVAPNQYLAK